MHVLSFELLPITKLSPTSSDNPSHGLNLLRIRMSLSGLRDTV